MCHGTSHHCIDFTKTNATILSLIWKRIFFWGGVWIFVLLREPSNQTSVYFPQSYSWPSWCGKRVFLSALVPLGCPFPFGAIYQPMFCSVIYQTRFSKQNPSQTTVSYLFKVSSQLTIVRKAKVLAWAAGFGLSSTRYCSFDARL